MAETVTPVARRAAGPRRRVVRRHVGLRDGAAPEARRGRADRQLPHAARAFARSIAPGAGCCRWFPCRRGASPSCFPARWCDSGSDVPPEQTRPGDPHVQGDRIPASCTGCFRRSSIGSRRRWTGVRVFQIHGGRDPLIPARRVEADEIIPDGGHLINVTHAREVNAFIRTAACTTSGRRLNYNHIHTA